MYIKVGFKGVYITRTRYPDENKFPTSSDANLTVQSQEKARFQKRDCTVVTKVLISFNLQTEKLGENLQIFRNYLLS